MSQQLWRVDQHGAAWRLYRFHDHAIANNQHRATLVPGKSSWPSLTELLGDVDAYVSRTPRVRIVNLLAMPASEAGVGLVLLLDVEPETVPGA